MMSMTSMMSMTASRSAWRGHARTCVALVGLWAAAPGCVQVPQPLELEPEDEEAKWRAVEPESVTQEDDASGPDYAAWPRASEPWLASLDERQIREYPLWPTPIDEPCPAVMFGAYTPQLDGGDTFDRVTARLASVEGHLGVSPSEITFLHDHVDVEGLRLVAASDTSGGCHLGWSHTHCFVSDAAVYCPDGRTDDLARLVQDHRLSPTSLDRVGWFELAVVMSGAERIVIEPALVGECTFVQEVEALAPAVEIDDERVTVRFTAFIEGEAIDYTVRIDRDGQVTMEREARCVLPSGV